MSLEGEGGRSPVELEGNCGFIDEEYLQRNGEIRYCPENVKLDAVAENDGKFNGAVNDGGELGRDAPLLARMGFNGQNAEEKDYPNDEADSLENPYPIDGHSLLSLV